MFDYAKVGYSRDKRRKVHYSLGRQLVENILLYVFCKFPLLAWAVWQLQYNPIACGTLRKHFTKPFLQVAAPECTHILDPAYSFLLFRPFPYPLLAHLAFAHIAKMARQSD